MVVPNQLKSRIITLLMLVASLPCAIKGQPSDGIPINLFDLLLQDLVPELLNQKADNENGTMSQNEALARSDNSNDAYALSKLQEIITGAGFEFENHYVISEDGYITQLVNIINPLADRSKLKQPPVVLFHGGLINPTVYFFASIRQHHPEKYPRSAEDGPITSSNRSLGFALANNGYDVWVAGTRGSSEDNRGYISPKRIGTVLRDGLSRAARNTILESIANGVGDLATGYFLYSMDELIKYEIPAQIDAVLEITGAKNVSVLTYSFSSLMSLSLFGSYPEQAAKVHNYINWAPTLNLDGSNNLWKLVVKDIFLNLENNLGTVLVTQTILSQGTRDLLVALSTSKAFRYTILKGVSTLLLGASAKYETFFELSVVGHVFEPVGFQEIKHYCQQATANTNQMYDFGPAQNLLTYGNARPPVYNISNIHIDNWLFVTGANDQLGTPGSARKVLAEVRPKPYRHIDVGPYNHFDLAAAFDNDIMINLPILEFLDTFAIIT